MKCELPYARAGQVIGLLGGSFDPAHSGHAHITREALKRFGLDKVWWLVSPGNPLKAEGPAPMDRRLTQARAVMNHPRVEVTDIEARIGTRYTAQTLQNLQELYPGVKFVWLMGADNLADFHRWGQWEWIAENVAMGVIARPGTRLSARTSKAAERYHRFRIQGRHSQRLGKSTTPAWCFINVPMVDISSTEIRARGDWHR
ncbi:nicotinic acid mononucleotide adenylyltransferase [Actibacterium atlanticum]|uniref:Probable nicotinate-nucleotide adenylyltransferase n=1 Tax=Actibacterium atlanticum TaxID=1461693 RepID=A0A058ZM82_9RHOB|nr:nicotinate-nucleotide adenylyltransferase [Actibacterium atlanticum]KCV81926.1 nicotinic acid mononucleotide adenylyltransferase [Actibacterium atlanticum]